MTVALLYALAGIVLFGFGLYALVTREHLLRKVLAFNVMGSGVFLALVGLARHGGGVDPVSHALVLTGIVVAVSATGLALALVRRLHDAGGAAPLDNARERR